MASSRSDTDAEYAARAPPTPTLAMSSPAAASPATPAPAAREMDMKPYPDFLQVRRAASERGASEREHRRERHPFESFSQVAVYAAVYS
jgi:hypothetical protein